MTNFVQLRTMMVDTQVRPSDVTKFPIIEAMLTVPREDFVPSGLREAAYVGDHVSLGQGRVVLDARVLAKMLDAMDIQNDELVLDIGCGLGYSSALIARMAQAVIAVEVDADLAKGAQDALANTGSDNVVVEVSALENGAPQHGPYDAVILQGAVEEINSNILDQIKEGGRICAIFIDGTLGVVRMGYKINGEISWRMAFNASAPMLPGFASESVFAL